MCLVKIKGDFVGKLLHTVSGMDKESGECLGNSRERGNLVLIFLELQLNDLALRMRGGCGVSHLGRECG